jgi:cytoskeleton protein RodZ
MPSVAEQLRQAREANRLTVENVADIIKLRSDHVRALEEGDYNVFSAPVYIRGFVRSYSTLLKLEVPQIMAALDAELGQTKRFAEPPPLTGPPRGILDFLMLQLSKIDWRKAAIVLGALAAVMVIALAYVSWRRYHTRDPLQNLKPGVYRPAQRGAGDTLPLPSR